MDFRSIHNFYEHLVIEYMRDEVSVEMNDHDTDFLLDVACYAMNRLPARYFRHEIDMAFFLTTSERERMVADVKKTVDDAIVYIKDNFNKNDRYKKDPADENE